MITALFAAPDENWDAYEAPLHRAFSAQGLTVHLTRSAPADQVDYIIYSPRGGLTDFTPFTNAKAILSLWAGVENILGAAQFTQPLCRMVDDGLERGMVEWVTGHVLRYHLGMDAHIVNPNREWHQIAPPLAQDRRVTILGLGTLGTACAEALASLRFQITGWSRRPKEVRGVRCLAGDEGLKEALSDADIVVLLLPETPATTHVINAETLGWMPKGAVLLNPGRGPLIDEPALIDALNSNHTSAATLDAFAQEPLPDDHPFWSHPKVTVTPHIASETRPTTAAEVIAENIRRGENGEDFLYQVDTNGGY